MVDVLVDWNEMESGNGFDVLKLLTRKKTEIQL